MAKVHLKVRSGLLVKGITAYPSDAEEGDLVFRSDLFKYSIYRNGNWADLIDDRLVQLLSTTDSTTTGASAQLTATPTPFIRLTNISLTGLATIPAGGNGQVITLSNVTGSPITVFDETGITLANRIKTGTAKPIKLSADASINLIYDASSARWRVIGGTGSGSGTGSGIGDDLDSLTFRASFDDEFNELPSDTASAVNGNAGNTNSTYSAANGLYVISYDASKTVAAGTTSTNINLSSAPTFTVAVGDIVISGSEARRVTVVNSTLSFTTEAFITTPTVGTQITVSQAVQTKDIYNLPVDGNALSAAFSGATFSEILVDYEDTSAPGDAIFDVNTAPVVAYTASGDGTTYGLYASRPTLETSTVNSYILPSAGTSLYIRLFALKTSGSGTVNILRYKAFMQKSVSSIAGGVINSAYAFTNSVGTPVNCTIGSVGGKTTVALNFSYAVGVNTGSPYGSLDVYLNGQLIPRFINSTLTPDGSYTELSSTVLQLDKDYSTQNISVEVLQRSQIVDSSTTNTTQLSDLQEVNQNGFQAFVNQNQMMSPTSTAGTPAAGTFYSSIVGRASVVDFSQDLKPRMGINRMMTIGIFLLQDEFGPSGETVFGSLNDSFNQIRFVGSWTSSPGNYGQYLGATYLTDYAEITFFGTGLNLVAALGSPAYNYQYSVDGGSVVSFFNPSNNSAVLGARNYSVNTIVPIVSGLSNQVHTIKIVSSSSALNLYGFEILNESSSVKTNPGIAYNQGKKIVNSSQSVIPYASAVAGTVGGRVLQYIKSDGTIGQSFQPVNSSPAYLSSADHTNEELVRTYHYREFGAGRADDFSGNSSSDSFFTLDDGTTSIGVNGGVQLNTANGIKMVSGGGYTNIIFVGCGIDIIQQDDANGGNDPYSYSIDGAAPQTFCNVGNTTVRTVKMASGLPYGTHELRLTRNSPATFNIIIQGFKVYQPKKPVLPTGAVELADYNVFANYVLEVNSTGIFTGSISTGVLLKNITAREAVYLGTWGSGSINTNYELGTSSLSSTAGNAVSYTFTGTGFEFNEVGNSAYGNFNVTLNGVALNASYPGAASINAATYGTVSYGSQAANTSYLLNTVASNTIANGSSNNIKSGLSVTNLPYGTYTVTFTKADSSTTEVTGFKVVTPIHSTKSNLYADLQNTLPVGSQSISDNRKLTPVKDILPAQKSWAQAVGVTANPSTTVNTAVPMPDMSCTIKTTGGALQIAYNVSLQANLASYSSAIYIYVDGLLINFKQLQDASTTLYETSDLIIVPVSPGFHKVDLYWSEQSGATLTAFSTNRNLTVREI